MSKLGQKLIAAANEGVAIAKDAGASAPAPTGHSRFGASGADRWIECPGSVIAQEGKSDKTTEYAAEGTAGHSVAAMCLETGQDAIEFTDRTFEVDGHFIEFGEELADAVQLYLDTIRTDKSERGGKLVVEKRFHLKWLDEEFFGTSDCCRLGKDDVLSVYDLKLGKGKVVEVEGNRQLAYYALGALMSFPPSLRDKIKEIELVLIQPRAYHADGPVRRWRTTPADLLRYSKDLIAAAENARSPSPVFKAGDHCTFCRAAGTCSVLKDHALAEANIDFDDVSGEPVFVDPTKLSEKELGRMLDAADLIDAWLKALWTHAERAANEGVVIPGWKLADKRAMRKWREDDKKTENALLFDFRLDESAIFSHKLKSPAQIEKLLPKAERAGLASLYAKESSGTKLVRATDPRDARPPSHDAQADFDDGSDDYEW